MSTSKRITTITQMGMLCAVSLILVAIIRIPFFPPASFLEYDAADIPVLIGTIIFGPVNGLILLIIVSAFQAMIFSPVNGIFGFVMHVLATGMLLLPVGILHSIYRNRKSVGIGLSIGCLLMTLMMAAANVILNPIFYHMPRQAVIDLLLPGIIPFNLMKSVINSVSTFILYKPVRIILGKFFDN